VGKREGKISLGIPGHTRRWEDNVKVDIQAIG
jgi:hypothetical protein